MFYGVLGSGLSVLGILMLFGLVDLSRFGRQRGGVSSGGQRSATAPLFGGPSSTGYPPNLEQLATPTEVYRPENTNPAAFTRDGGRRTDDPVPVLLPDSARGSGTAHLRVYGLVRAGWSEYVRRRVLEAVPLKFSKSQGQPQTIRMTLPGVEDLEALAGIIDFGTVTSIDQAERLIEVKVAPRGFPSLSERFNRPPGALAQSSPPACPSRPIRWTSCFRD